MGGRDGERERKNDETKVKDLQKVKKNGRKSKGKKGKGDEKKENLKKEEIKQRVQNGKPLKAI